MIIQSPDPDPLDAARRLDAYLAGLSRDEIISVLRQVLEINAGLMADAQRIEACADGEQFEVYATDPDSGEPATFPDMYVPLDHMDDLLNAMRTLPTSAEPAYWPEPEFAATLKRLWA